MIPYGYKQTEVGVIPEDWNLDNFKNVGAFFKGAGISMKDTRPTGLPCIMYGDIYVRYDTYFKECNFRIDDSTALKSSKAVQNDLLFTASGETAEEIGKCVSYQGDDDIYIGGDIIAIRPSSEYDSLFLAYVQNSAFLIKQKATLAQGHTVVHINKHNIESLRFVCPPLPEQQRIAEALSDVDGMISSLEKLIAKYKSIKTACLQQMFPQNGETVPRMRLPGFTGAWEQRKAKEICSIGTGKSNTQDQVDDGKYPFYIRSDVPVRSNKYLYDCEAVITIGDGNIGKVFHYVNGKFDLHQRCYKMTDFKDIWGKYFFYYFSTKFYDRAMKMTAKATVDSVRLEMISEMDIKKPPQISEQKQIAEFFANLDNLITLHQRKLEKIQKIKQGMMQQLLTGKIRLV